jgi:hypothetical protein
LTSKDKKRLNDLFLRKENYIDSKLKSLDKDVLSMQRSLLEMIMSDYAGKFRVDENGKILVNEYNMRLAREIETLMDRFSAKFQKSVLKDFANGMLKTTEFSMDYFQGLGYAKSKLKSIENNMGFISERIGISDKGNILKGSYLDSLSQNAEVRKELKDFVINSVAGQKDYASYLKGIKELIVGNDTVEGALQRYYREFAYDTYNQVDSAINKHFADSLELTYFIYMGSIIETSREFCRKRAGKAFSIEETEAWKNDPDLPGKSKEDYNPLIDRGRWNCRHSLRYIPYELACDMRPDLCEDNVQ